MASSGFKDPSALHIDDPARFRERFDALLAAAAPVEQPAAAAGKRIPVPARAPFPLAEAFVKECAMRGEDRTLHHWAERWWWWNGSRYIERPHREQRSALACFIRDRVEILVPKGERAIPQEPTSWDTNNAIDALEAVCTIAGEMRPPVLLEGADTRLDAGKSVLGAIPGQREGMPRLVSVQNGIVELGSGELRAPSPRWFSMDVLGAEYDPDAECPEWMRFLERVWSDEASIATLQEIFGYLLTPDMSQQKAFLIVGPPRSGKGTIGRVLQALLGDDSVTRPALADFGQNFGLEPLIGKTLAIVSDARLDGNVPGGVLAERLLAISGQDTINVARKYASAWTGPLNVRFLILSNETPRFRDASGALPRRFIVLRMLKSWLGNEDPELFERLACELPGILNWAIEGWRRLQERGRFVQPASGLDDLDDMLQQANPLLGFLESECERNENARVNKQEIYQRYLKWVDETQGKQSHRLAMPTFFRDLKSTWPEIRTARGHGPTPREVVGVRLVSEWEKAAREAEG